MPRTKITSAFKAPRQVTGKEGGSGKDEVEGPLVTGRRHRKDNSEWGKRMEKELARTLTCDVFHSQLEKGQNK
jgi:hypothetical protein